MLKESSIRKIKTLLGQNLQNQDGYFNKLQWTKKLTIRDDRNDKLEQQGFITLISYSPKLQEIDLRGTAFNNTCTAYLRNVDSTIYLKNIEIIWGGRPSTNQDHYVSFATFYNFRKTLTRTALNCTHRKPTLTVCDKTGKALTF